MINEVIAVICIFTTIIDIFAITVNRKSKYMAKLWTIVSIVTATIICVCWCITAVYIKRDPLWLDYMFSVVYATLVISRVLSLDDILLSIDRQKTRRESKYVYRMGMLIKKDEEIFDDDRPLYCASSLLLPNKSEEHNDEN